MLAHMDYAKWRVIYHANKWSFTTDIFCVSCEEVKFVIQKRKAMGEIRLPHIVKVRRHG